MEEIDNIIIHSLRQIGCDIPESDHGGSLGSLDPRDVVRCVSRCLRIIDPSLQLPESMPTGMAQKYGATLALAETCTQIGFRGDIGYQTFLYSNNTAELRRVLMFLIDRLPKEEEPVLPSREMSATERTELEMKRSLGVSLRLPRKVLPIMEEGRLLFSAPANYDARRSIFTQTTPQNIWSTLITHNDSEGRSYPSKPMPPKTLKRSSVESSRKVQVPENEDIGEDSSKIMPEEDPLDQKRAHIESLREQIAQKRLQASALGENIAEIQRMATAAEQTLHGLKVQKKTKERTLLVLENPQENTLKLTKMIENSGEKMKRLQEQWIEHKTPLQSRLDELNSQKALEASKTKVIDDQILEARQKQTAIRAEASVKAQQYAQWMAELGKVNQKIDRSAYTSRILEIIGNIRKQKTDIDKILGDTRQVQKDINTVTGKLERQFTVTDDFLFGHATRDEQTKRAYKLFLKAHTDCGELAKSIQDTGKISREIKDLEEQIENSRARNTAANIQQVSMDLEEMAAENKALFQEIQRRRTGVSSE